MFFRFVISRLFIHMTNKLSSAFVWNVYLVDALFSCLHGYSAFGCYACLLYFLSTELVMLLLFPFTASGIVSKHLFGDVWAWSQLLPFLVALLSYTILIQFNQPNFPTT